jgi:hypothetical protein
MDPNQLFAGAGASGGVVMALFILYKLLQHSHCKSNCCGRVVSIDVSQTTPPVEQKEHKDPERRPSVFVDEKPQPTNNTD